MLLLLIEIQRLTEFYNNSITTTETIYTDAIKSLL
jgi:hypothetical protein